MIIRGTPILGNLHIHLAHFQHRANPRIHQVLYRFPIGFPTGETARINRPAAYPAA